MQCARSLRRCKPTHELHGGLPTSARGAHELNPELRVILQPSVMTNPARNDTEASTSAPTSADVKARPKKSTPPRVSFYPLPDYAANRQTHPGARDNESMVTLPQTGDYLERFKDIATPGFYFAEYRSGGKIVNGEVIEIPATVRLIEDDEDDDEDSIDIEEIKRAAIDGARQAVSEVLAERDAREASTSKAKESSASFLEQLRALKELQAEVTPSPALVMQAAPATNDGDMFDKVLTMFDRVTDMRERLAPEPLENPNSSTIEKILSAIPLVIQNAPVLAPLLGLATQPSPPRAAAKQPQPARTPPPPAEPKAQSTPEVSEPGDDAPEDPLRRVLTDAAVDLKNDADVRLAAKDLVRFLEDSPQYRGVIDQALNATDAQLVNVLQQFVDEPLAELPHAERFAVDLRAEVERRLAASVDLQRVVDE